MIDFVLLGSKITADNNCRLEIKRHLLLGRKAMTNLDSILKSRDSTWPIKVHIVKAMVFPEIRYRCEGWTIKKARHQGIDAFKLGCWKRFFRIPWTTERSHESILKESNGKSRQCAEKQRHHFVDKSPYSQTNVFFQ